MEPINFEENIKKEFEKRSLQPSNDAWDKLSKQLDVQEAKTKTNNKRFLWLGIAASIIGVLFVMHQFNKTEVVEEIQEIVIIPKVVNKNDVSEEKLTKELLEGVKSKVKSTKSIKYSIQLKKGDINKEEVVLSNKKVIHEQERGVLESVKISQKDLTFEEQKVQDVVAQIKALKESKGDITEANIELLLKQAQKEIALKRLIKDRTRTVDANLLLQDVETEIDQSFRSKVFETLKSSFNSVKTTVAQRND
ncbi:hypothetical protein A8C32_16245 [Flavivirga aquatica]|uniref:Uncharacterized protein n=1 Tax=Flavivirga aquatica TaxID=1849968 RepID=A0A1E5T9J2_9FLAO|nr:hypothetical protein [Flavivirga aquatica]OEK08006.1 hypothetical protein A8C32_16245 [Flavivirga aquatica]